MLQPQLPKPLVTKSCEVQSREVYSHCIFLYPLIHVATLIIMECLRYSISKHKGVLQAAHVCIHMSLNKVSFQ